MRLEDTDYAYLTGEEVRGRIGRMTLTTATDGNHGRGIAWAAQQLRQNAVIYMPRGTVASRIENIRRHGATVEVTDLNYDDAVRLAGRMALRAWMAFNSGHLLGRIRRDTPLDHAGLHDHVQGGR